MVSQTPHPDDATPDERVATLLAAAAAPAEAGPQPGEEQVLAAFRAAPHRTRRIPMTSFPSSAHRAKIAVAATIGAGTFLFAGVGAAAAGVLPDAAQDTASTVLGQLGFEVPRANDAAGDHPAQRGAEEDADTTATDADATETDTGADETGTDATGTETADTEAEGSQGKGTEVSGLATTTDAEGADKGAEISTTASGGKSRAGAEHTAPEPAAGADDADAADDADDADDGATEDNDDASASGTDTADEASSGRLAAGSGDRP